MIDELMNVRAREIDSDLFHSIHVTAHWHWALGAKEERA